MVEAFTYEDIYELFRNEQYSSDLQTLTSTDLKRIKLYFEEKNDETKNQDQSLNLFSTHNRAKIQVELSNATRVVKDMLERRERKVISRAVFNSRSNDSMRDTSNMLNAEEQLYDTLINLLRVSRKSILETIDNDGVSPNSLKSESTKLESIYYALSDIPEFFGPKMNKLGPFKLGDEVSVPHEISEILLTQGKIGTKKPLYSDASKLNQPIEELKNEVLTGDITNQNEISETNKDILSFKKLQESHDAQDQTFEEQGSSKNKKERTQ
jgi:DNA replication initiation complex subunit (GINS family)